MFFIWPTRLGVLQQRRLLLCGWTLDRCRRSSAATATARNLPQSTIKQCPASSAVPWVALLDHVLDRVAFWGSSFAGKRNETCECHCHCHCQPRRPLTPAPRSHIAHRTSHITHRSPRALCNRAPPCKLRSTYSFTSARHRRESLNALTLHY